MNTHQNRKALVTGAASGIGAAIAELLNDRGAIVLGVDVDQDGLRRLETRKRLGTLNLDVAEDDAPRKVLAAVDEELGGLDILINAAGICPVEALEGHSLETWDRVMNVNLRATFRLCVAAVERLKHSPAGRIINIGSIMSDFAGPGTAAYGASKHGVAGLTKSLATEFGCYGITANYIQPGAILTGITQPLYDSDADFRNYWTQKAALGRWGMPLDIAYVASFLASEEASFVSGHGIYADGGAMQQA